MTFAEQRYTDIPNPMCELFPRIAACNYVRYGSAGGQEFKQAICVLGMNMINDKVTTLKNLYICSHALQLIKESMIDI
jgi:hypothetical protein